MDGIKAVTGGGKGKGKNNPKMMILIVGGIIVLLLVLMRRQQPASSDAPVMYADSYDQLGEYMQNNGGIIQGQVDSQLNAGLASIEASNNAMLNDYFGNLEDYLKERDDDTLAQLKKLEDGNKKLSGDLEAQQKQNATQQSAIDALKKPVAKPSPKPPTKKPAPKPSTIKVSYKGNSIVDALKSVGVNSSMSNRAALAKKNGITNYKGTASQNTALLNKAKAGTLRK